MLFPETERAEGVEREMGSEEIEAEEEVLLSWQVTHHRRLVGRPPLLLTCLRAPHRLNPCLRIWCFFFPRSLSSLPFSMSRSPSGGGWQDVKVTPGRLQEAAPEQKPN